MNESGMDRRGTTMDARRLPAFCGLGLCVDAALFRAVRLERSLTRHAPDARLRPVPAPQRPWGIELLVTLGRQTRAG
ncbi:hypothetical protein [Fundidesulfovibrio terrae]|uniref:hypothetical protein n=1 Tax=Fundidesulfovibrio terrae TaxID=2922866 RepID=UPI001FAEFE40|nr:hypothetical protein [Fundidesulfovibrio terrae]